MPYRSLPLPSQCSSSPSNLDRQLSRNTRVAAVIGLHDGCQARYFPIAEIVGDALSEHHIGRAASTPTPIAVVGAAARPTVSGADRASTPLVLGPVALTVALCRP
ncbi:hypothetical protein [Nocardia brevicatena]|uniref:hypothetical protein n=1 Tax=Nocardia brevicatena TaxID=37327 RepID=UPI0002D572F2|nr:hypothetical protein [Nocardia brevicatena]